MFLSSEDCATSKITLHAAETSVLIAMFSTLKVSP